MASPLRLAVAVARRPAEVAGATRPGEVAADRAWAAVTEVFERAEAAMSRFRDDSELTGLNRRAPEPAAVSDNLRQALVAADRARRMTDGRFDPRIVDALERVGYLGVRQRSATEPGRPCGLDAGRDSALDAGRGAGRDGRILGRAGRRGSVSLPEPVDLGGIGKGLALRWAARALDRLAAAPSGPGPTGYLIEAGGDIVVSGSPDGPSPWMVGIEDPWGGPNPIAVVVIQARGAIATSSVRRLFWERDGRTVHHLIDPRTGKPGGDGIVAVTVAGPDPAWVEVWSKTLFLEGARGIAGLARARGLAAWWATDDGRLEMTAAARIRTAWVAGER